MRRFATPARTRPGRRRRAAFRPPAPLLVLAAAAALAGSTGCARADTEPPPTPAGLTAQAGSAGSAHVMWDPPADADGVTVHLVFQGGRLVRELPADKHMLDVPGLAPRTRYEFTVRARDAAGNLSAPSSPAAVTTPADLPLDHRPPTAPASAAGSPAGPRTVRLSWSAATDDSGVTAYDVYRDGVRIHSVAGTETGTRLTGLRPDTVYTFTVRARDGADNSSPDSPPVDVTTEPADGPGPGTAPADFTATAGPGTVTLSWLPPDTGHETRTYELHVDGRPTTVIQFGEGAAVGGRTEHRLTVAEPPGTVWQLKLRARLPDGGWGSFSAERRVVLVR
ncbi:fibronectin type III domain-containing protein [Streptomyces sp. NPDC012888]|uniref:fibronectin type III domain-containing protein n=1 Tax=Streptomyces sp. NPDC012888 TaxID=3364855 RepID=UPI003692023B